MYSALYTWAGTAAPRSFCRWRRSAGLRMMVSALWWSQAATHRVVQRWPGVLAPPWSISRPSWWYCLKEFPEGSCAAPVAKTLLWSLLPSAPSPRFFPWPGGVCCLLTGPRPFLLGHTQHRLQTALALCSWATARHDREFSMSAVLSSCRSVDVQAGGVWEQQEGRRWSRSGEMAAPACASAGCLTYL